MTVSPDATTQQSGQSESTKYSVILRAKFGRQRREREPESDHGVVRSRSSQRRTIPFAALIRPCRTRAGVDR